MTQHFTAGDPTRSSLHTPPGQPADSKVVGSTIVEDNQWIGARRFEISEVAGGCLVAWGSIALSCALLVINGAFVMAVLAALAASGIEWVTNEKASQFILFAGPLALLVIQWMLIDTLRRIFNR